MGLLVYVKILGKLWKFRRVKNLFKRKGAWGWIDPPSVVNKTLEIDDSLEGEEELVVIIHEMLHASDWTKDEEWIHETAADLGRMLTRLGYKKCE